MKSATSIFILAFLLFCALAQAQDRIDASDIIARLDAGENIELNNVTITGILDFNEVADSDREDDNGWSDGKKFLAHVRNKVSFVDCTFTGMVLGYRSENGRPWKSSIVYNTDFHEAVTFRNCTFKRDVRFKYTRFYEGADFQESNFGGDINFKYTEFDERADFSGVEIDDEANFKYTEFPEGVSFAGASFEGDADFKYVKFRSGVSFANATFDGGANFKYTKFKDPSDFDGVKFGRRGDFKYTTLNGKKFRPGK